MFPVCFWACSFRQRLKHFSEAIRCASEYARFTSLNRFPDHKVLQSIGNGGQFFLPEHCFCRWWYLHLSCSFKNSPRKWKFCFLFPSPWIPQKEITHISPPPWLSPNQYNSRHLHFFLAVTPSTFTTVINGTAAHSRRVWCRWWKTRNVSRDS